MSIMKLTATIAVFAALTATSAFARDNVQVAGSSIVLNCAAMVAEALGENFDFLTPVIASGVLLAEYGPVLDPELMKVQETVANEAVMGSGS